jgi:hypothetical protein
VLRSHFRVAGTQRREREPLEVTVDGGVGVREVVGGLYQRLPFLFRPRNFTALATSLGTDSCRGLGSCTLAKGSPSSDRGCARLVRDSRSVR